MDHEKEWGSPAAGYYSITPELNPPSKWKCYLFGTGTMGIMLRPLKGQEPNWFHRKMQYLLLGNEWVKDK